MSVLGNLLLLVSLIASVASAISYTKTAASSSTSRFPARFLISISAGSVILASILLLILIISHDFTNGYVFGYSDRSLPLHFLISSFYAGQEGSFLFWALCSGIIAVVLARYTAKRGSERSVMAVFMMVHSIFLLLVLTKSPFRLVWEMYSQIAPGRIPLDGRGLNPLLQNFWMVVHPPVLFLGFATMAVPFSVAIAGLWRRDYQLLGKQGFSWLLFAVAVLGLGLMLGAYWAYGVLGWGGYWGWDPVENSSLVPWLTGIALVHTLLAQRRTLKFIRTNLILAIVTFLLVVYSTFLTRSGVLGDASVHAFTDPGAGVYWMLLAFLALIALSGIVLLVVRRKDLRQTSSATAWLSREMALGAGMLILVLSAVVVLFGTSLPIFSRTRVEPAFYDTTNLPVAIAMGLLIGFSLFMQWESAEGKEVLGRSLKAVTGSVIGGIILFAGGVTEPLMLALAFSAFFALLVNIEIGIKVARGDPRFLGGKLAHAGVAFFLLGVLGSGRYNATERVGLPLNSPQRVLGREMTYKGNVMRPDGKYEFTVEVIDQGKHFRLAPVMFDAGQQGVMRTPDIASFITRDIYVSPVAVEEPEVAGTAHERYTVPKGDSIAIGDARARFVRFDMGGHGGGMAGGGSMEIGSVLEITSRDARETVTPAAIYRGNAGPEYRPAPSRILNASVQLVGLNVGMGGGARSTVTFEVQPVNDASHPMEILVVEASVKPYISLVWGGTLVMMGGFLLSILKRSQEA